MQLLIISRLHILTMVLIKIGKTIIEVHWGLHEGRDCDIDFASRSPIALVVVPCFNFHNIIALSQQDGSDGNEDDSD